MRARGCYKARRLGPERQQKGNRHPFVEGSCQRYKRSRYVKSTEPAPALRARRSAESEALKTLPSNLLISQHFWLRDLISLTKQGVPFPSCFSFFLQLGNVFLPWWKQQWEEMQFQNLLTWPVFKFLISLNAKSTCFPSASPQTHRCKY